MAVKVSIGTFVHDIYEAYKRKDGYIMASTGQNPKTGYHDLSVTTVKSAWKPTGWYYSQYTNQKQHDQAIYWRDHATRVWDCQGLADGVYEIHTGTKIDVRARDNYAGWCEPKGSGMIPVKYRVPGACVFWGDAGKPSTIHHVGYLYKPVTEGHPEDDWYIIEARGVMYGVVMTKLYGRKPNYWGWMVKYYDYSDYSVVDTPVQIVEPTPASTPAPSTSQTKLYFNRNLKTGCKGDDVKALQEALISMGYDLSRYGADGDFGKETAAAVKAFQKDNGLEVDGIFGEKSYAAYLSKVGGKIDNTISTTKKVKITGGSVNIRNYPSTSSTIIAIAHEGETYDYIKTDSQSGWHQILYKGYEVWVSYKYSKVI